MKNNFAIESWDEATYLELDGDVKYSKAAIRKEYRGVINGAGELQYLMAYNASGGASFVGLEHVTATIDGKQGSFTLSHEGRFEDGKVSSTFAVVVGSGAGELADLSGQGNYSAGHGREVEFDFEHTFLEA